MVWHIGRMKDEKIPKKVMKMLGRMSHRKVGNWGQGGWEGRSDGEVQFLNYPSRSVNIKSRRTYEK